MGHILSVRVMAQTLDEEEVAKAWPALCTLVWPDWMRRLKLQDLKLEKLMGPTLGISAVEKSLGTRKHGVVELAQGLEDMLAFGEMPAPAREALKEPVEQVVQANLALAKALADWNPNQASGLTSTLETALGQAERAAKRL